MGDLLPILFILCIGFDVGSSLTADHVWSWINDTFCSTSTCTYRQEIFPRDALSDTIYVDMELSLISLSDFDEVAGHLELVGTLRIKWTDDIVLDPYLTASSLNPPTYSFTDVLIPQDEVWKPPITVFNSVNALNSVGDSNYYVRITVLSSGAKADMEWFPGIVTRTACSVDVSNYPWDIQSCDVVFTPWGYQPTEITFNLSSTAVDTSKFQGSDIWEIKSSTGVQEAKGNSSFAKYTLQLARKPSFFLKYIVLPIELLSFLNLMVFVLPADSGERVGYSVTVFLTLAVYVTIISDNLPKTSSPMSIFAYFLITMLMMSAFICFVTIISLRIYIRTDEDPVPKWLKRLVAVVQCRCCCKKETEEVEQTDLKKPPTSKSKVIVVDSGSPAGRWAKLREQVTHRNGNINQKVRVIDEPSDSEDSAASDDETEDDEEMEWSDVGKAVDLFFLFLFFILIALISVAFLVPLASTRM